jgi:hypothetical protein
MTMSISIIFTMEAGVRCLSLSLAYRTAPVSASMSSTDSIGGGSAEAAWRRGFRSPGSERDTMAHKHTTNAQRIPPRTGLLGIPAPPFTRWSAGVILTSSLRCIPHTCATRLLEDALMRRWSSQVSQVCHPGWGDDFAYEMGPGRDTEVIHDNGIFDDGLLSNVHTRP